MTLTSKPLALFWHRRDLRIDDLPALEQLLDDGFVPVPVFIFDPAIIASLPVTDQRLSFIYDSLLTLSAYYAQHGVQLHLLHGKPDEILPIFCQQHGVSRIYAHQDVEPSSQQRDTLVRRTIPLYTQWDHLIIAPDSPALLNPVTHQPYRVFSHFQKAWTARFQSNPPHISASWSKLKALGLPSISYSLPPLQQFGFQHNPPLILLPGFLAAKHSFQSFHPLIDQYHITRNQPFSTHSSSQLSPHFRFGTLSARRCAHFAFSRHSEGSLCWLSELIWRDFYAYILYHYPHLFSGDCFQSQWNNYPYANNPQWIDAWKTGTTGFSFVDAGIKELLQTGLMHNRLRMITAQFLVKLLNCDWRIGEAFFAQHLLDFDWASNNGGWQWCASTGTDAQPYFRIFNPYTQQETHDPQLIYTKQWNPSPTPPPIIDYSLQRSLCLQQNKQWLDQYKSS